MTERNRIDLSNNTTPRSKEINKIFLLSIIKENTSSTQGRRSTNQFLVHSMMFYFGRNTWLCIHVNLSDAKLAFQLFDQCPANRRKANLASERFTCIQSQVF